MANFKRLNLNPYKRNTGDCMIRALVAGTFYGYKTLCEMMDVPFIKGRGNDGVPLNRNIKFANETNIIEDFPLELPNDKEFDFPTREVENFQKFHGFSMKFWIDTLKYNPKNGSGRIIFICKKNKIDDIQMTDDTTSYHSVYGNIQSKDFYDTWDSGESLVLDAFQVKKIAKPSDPFFFKTEEKDIQEENRKYLNSLKKTI